MSVPSVVLTSELLSRSLWATTPPVHLALTDSSMSVPSAVLTSATSLVSAPGLSVLFPSFLRIRLRLALYRPKAQLFRLLFLVGLAALDVGRLLSPPVILPLQWSLL